MLKALHHGSLSAGELISHVSLSLGTVTDILNRLQQRGLIQRLRDTQNRRRPGLTATITATAPGAFFVQRLNKLHDWEQTQLLASLQRIAAMMDAEYIDAAPVLSSGSALASAEAMEEVLEPESTDEIDTLTDCEVEDSSAAVKRLSSH